MRSYLLCLLSFGFIFFASNGAFAYTDCREFYGTYYFHNSGSIYQISVTEGLFTISPSIASYSLGFPERGIPAEINGYDSAFTWDANKEACSATFLFKLGADGYRTCTYRGTVSVNALSNGQYIFRAIFPTVSSEQHQSDPCESSNLDINEEDRYFAYKQVPQ